MQVCHRVGSKQVQCRGQSPTNSTWGRGVPTRQWQPQSGWHIRRWGWQRLLTAHTWRPHSAENHQAVSGLVWPTGHTFPICTCSRATSKCMPPAMHCCRAPRSGDWPAIQLASARAPQPETSCDACPSVGVHHWECSSTWEPDWTHRKQMPATSAGMPACRLRSLWTLVE